MSSLNDDLLIKQLLEEEGLRLLPYVDTAGKLTIGCGRNLTDVGISKKEAYFLLANDIAAVKDQLDQELPWWRNESQVRQRVLINLCFNMGIGSLMGFRHTLAVWSQGDYAEAARALADSKWATDVQPSRRDRLIAMLRDGSTIA